MARRPPAEALALLIGEVTLAWTEVQFWAFTLFCRLLETKVASAHAIFFSIRSDRGQRELVVTLAEEKIKDATLLKGIKVAIEQANQLAGRRNDVLHGMWFVPIGWRKPSISFPTHNRLKDRNANAELKKLRSALKLLARKLSHYSDCLADAGFVWQSVKHPPPPDPSHVARAIIQQNDHRGNRRKRRSSRA